jgi:uncharacterized SAM-binding protein YcdF (DUF218 family)
MHKRLIFALIISLLVSNCSLFVPGPKKLNRRALAKHPQYDVVVVPGVPFREPEWDTPMLMRVIWSVHLYKRGYTKNIIMSGGAVGTPYVEAEIMKQYAIALGVPAERIFVEAKAEHSTENAWYGYLLAKKLGFKTVALATDKFQNNLLYRFVKRRIPDMQFLPTIFDSLRTLSHATPTIEYKQLRLKEFVSLAERESKLKRWRGTRGKNINFKDTVY